MHKLAFVAVLVLWDTKERIKRMLDRDIDPSNIWASRVEALNCHRSFSPEAEEQAPMMASVETITALSEIMPAYEWQGIELAARCEHTGDPEKAEEYRSLIGYGGLDAR